MCVKIVSFQNLMWHDIIKTTETWFAYVLNTFEKSNGITKKGLKPYQTPMFREMQIQSLTLNPFS